MNISINTITNIKNFFTTYSLQLTTIMLAFLSVVSYIYFSENGQNLLYNDARSHLDIARRVVENLKPGVAQLGSVWLPLPHVVMLPTIWIDFMWHSGLSGALPSMFAYIATGVMIYLFLAELKVGIFGRILGALVFALNLNSLYMQTTAMTELLLMAFLTAAIYELVVWHRDENLFRLVRSAFWIFLSTLIRYEGWFLFIFATAFVLFHNIRKYGYKKTEGIVIMFGLMASFGIFLWFFWNTLIFKDPLYFAFGPYSANQQQEQMAAAGALPTKHNFYVSLQTYTYALIYNTNPFFLFLAVIGVLLLFFDKKLKGPTKFAVTLLFVPYIFNVLALYLGHSSLYVENLNGSWFNVRYGMVMIPTYAIFLGYLVHRVSQIKFLILGLFLFVTFFSYMNKDSVSLDDALIGSSGKNVTEVSGWLSRYALPEKGFVMISVASHDAIIFSSGMPMKRFIHEGSGDYWDFATENPSKWARWIIMRTHDRNDLTYRTLEKNKQLNRYELMHKYPFADIYQLKPQYISGLYTEPVDFANK